MGRYIDADALIADVEQEIAECEKWRENCEPEKLDIAEQILDTLVRCRVLVEFMPPADVRPNVRGEWVHDKDDSRINGYCSRCGWEAIILETDVSDERYCPHCGADMRKKGEE